MAYLRVLLSAFKPDGLLLMHAHCFETRLLRPTQIHQAHATTINRRIKIV